MKRMFRLTCLLVMALTSITSFAQEGRCGEKIKWIFDGMTLEILYEGNDLNGSVITDYDMKSNLAPWNKKGLSKKIRKIKIGSGINRIGSCAFYNCSKVNSVEFEDQVLESIGWGAFYGCSSLLNIYLPNSTKKIERIAFANCGKLGAVEIPENCTVEDHAFMSCPNITNIIVPGNAHLGEYAFLSELNFEGKKRFALYGGRIQMLPTYITEANCKKYGLSQQSVAAYMKERRVDLNNLDSDLADKFIGQSDVDTIIPQSEMQRTNTFALIIGNEDYSQLHPVPYAKADARVFREYCIKALGIPSQNIVLSENATLNQMKRDIRWLGERVDVRNDGGNAVNVLVYYAGHGVPDESTHDAYLLPVDGYASDVSSGMSLNSFYSSLEAFKANIITVFIDACFSGSQRDGEMLAEGLRGVAVRPKEAQLGGNMIVFSAAQGDETAQPYTEKGHGLFTYFLLKKLQESNGTLSYGQLSEYINQNVRETAIQKGKSQTPTTAVSSSIPEHWKKWRF